MNFQNRIFHRSVFRMGFEEHYMSIEVKKTGFLTGQITFGNREKSCLEFAENLGQNSTYAEYLDF